MEQQNIYPLIVRASDGDREAQFELGLHWYTQADYRQAERWLRYAALQDHSAAKKLLAFGIREGNFLDHATHCTDLSIELLERFLTPQPTEQQIEKYQNYLQQLIAKEFQE